MTDSMTDVDNTAIVGNFLYALREGNLAIAESLLDEHLVYQNVGMPTLHGRRRTIALFQRALRPGVAFDVKIHRTAADGVTVLNERTDALIFGPVRLQFWVCGVFEVHDGRITLWRDYFDNLDFAKAIVRGLIGAVVPALRPRLEQ